MLIGCIPRRHSRHHFWNLFCRRRTFEFDASGNSEQENAGNGGRGGKISKAEETVSTRSEVKLENSDFLVDLTTFFEFDYYQKSRFGQ